MITDNTIDDSNARYWCIFHDKKIVQNAFDSVLKQMQSKQIQDAAQTAIRINDKISDSKKLKESKLMNESFWSKLNDAAEKMSHAPSSGGPGMVFQIANASQASMDQQANHAMAAAATGIALLPGVKNVSMNIAKVAAKNPVATAGTIAAVKIASDAVGDENDTWWEKLGKLVNKAWDIGKFIGNHGKALTIASTTIFALYKTAGIWLPLIGKMIKSMSRGDMICGTEFESNGEMYVAYFDNKSYTWQLKYKDFNLGEPAGEDLQQLLQTRFFQNFSQKCKACILPVLNNKNYAAICSAIGSASDDKTKKLLDGLVQNKDKIINNMTHDKIRY